MIYDFIMDVSEILGIDAPAISYDASHFPNDTTMVQCSPDGSTIHLRKVEKPDPDYFFMTAYALRHVWQIRNAKEIYFSDYKPMEECDTVDEYNLQPAAIDAHAFAELVMADFFHLCPVFEGLSETVLEKIRQRVEYLIETEFSE